MNTIKTTVLAMALAIGSITYANTEARVPSKPTSISKAISKLLDKHNLKLNAEVDARVTFTVNNNNEIVVVNVDSKNESLVSYVKARLNYKKLDVAAVSGKMYFLPIKVQRS